MARAHVSYSLALLTLATGAAHAQDDSVYAFDGSISRETLEAYLFHSATVMNMLGAEGRDDQLRMALNTGLKFAGRAFNAWGAEAYHVELLQRVKPAVERIHAADPEMILQGTIFEIITTSVNDVPIPAWVFEEFGLQVEERTFSYDAMLFPDGRMVNHWGQSSVPDVTRLETRMWMYFLGRLYVDAGFEAIHVGQIELMGQTDVDHTAWADVLNRIRAYAREKGRRRLMLLDGHVPSHGYLYDGDKLLLDFHSFPLRPKAVPNRPQEAVLEMGHLDTLYGRSKGGVTPSGWSCESLPYLVEVDNFGRSDHEGEAPEGDYFVWGYDEICWFARQPEEYRNEWLRYAVEFLRDNDPCGFLEMPFARCLAAPVDGQYWFYGNTRAPGMLHGFSIEQTVKQLWGHVAYDCRDAFLAGGGAGYEFGKGIWLNESEEQAGVVPAGSLAARVPAGGEGAFTWTAPEAGSYALAGAVGPGPEGSMLSVGSGGKAETFAVAGASRGYRALVDLAAGEAVRLTLRSPEAADVPFMLVVSRR